MAFSTSLVGQGNAGTTVAAITVPLCANGSADITGFSFYLYMDGPAYEAGKDLAQTDSSVVRMFPASKQWIQISTTFDTASASYLQLFFNPYMAWSGTIYIDQVQVTQ